MKKPTLASGVMIRYWRPDSRGGWATATIIRFGRKWAVVETPSRKRVKVSVTDVQEVTQ